MFRSCLVFVAFAAVGVSAGGDCTAPSGPDECPNPITLNDADGNFLRRICYINDFSTEADALTFCRSIGYTLLRIDSSDVETSFIAYLDSNEDIATGQKFWINGRIENFETLDQPGDVTFQLVDPNGSHTYFFDDADDADGNCLNFHYQSEGSFDYHGDNCDIEKKFICQKHGC